MTRERFKKKLTFSPLSPLGPRGPCSPGGPWWTGDSEGVGNFRCFLRRNSCSSRTLLLLLCQITFPMSCHCDGQLNVIPGYSKCSLFLRWAVCTWSKLRKMYKRRNWCIPLGHLVLLVLQPVQVKERKWRKDVSYLLSLTSCKCSIRGHVGVNTLYI